MSMGDKNGIIKPEEFPEKNAPADEEQKKRNKNEMPPARVVDDKLIGDDRDLQDALEKPEPPERDPACDNNY